MSRKLIITILVVLIIGIVGGTTVLIMSRLRDSQQPTNVVNSPDGLNEAETGSQNIADPNGDSDNDGLINSEENLWGTSIFNSDTDGDGFLDGEEVESNHNPTIASPNDLLPVGFKPGQEITPIQTAPSELIAVDEFFADNLDLTLGTKNYTEEYKSQYAESERTPDTLNTYARQQPIITQLPTPAEKVIQLQSQDTPIVTANYLDSVGTLNIFSDNDRLAEALDALFKRHDPTLINSLAGSVKNYQQSLVETIVPPSAANLQKLLLGYTELQAATYKTIGTYNSDPAKAMVAIRQLEENNNIYFPLIVQEVKRLQQLNKNLGNT